LFRALEILSTDNNTAEHFKLKAHTWMAQHDQHSGRDGNTATQAHASQPPVLMGKGCTLVQKRFRCKTS